MNNNAQNKLDRDAVTKALEHFRKTTAITTGFSPIFGEIRWSKDGTNADVCGRLVSLHTISVGHCEEVKIADFEAYFWNRNGEWRIKSVQSHVTDLLNREMEKANK